MAKKSKPKSGGKRGATATARAARRAAASAPPKVRVRMYRQGLGDCFLVTFDVGRNEKHVLIDCGTLGKKATTVTLPDVVADIVKTTGKRIDLIVATHEHLDHVIGFRRQQAAFAQCTIGHVWQAWTEDPDDDLAQQLAKTKHDLGAALTAAAQALEQPGMSDRSREIGRNVRSLLGFFEADEDGGGTFAASDNFSETVDEAMKIVAGQFGAELTYLLPPPLAPDTPAAPAASASGAAGGGAHAPAAAPAKPSPIEPDWLPGFRFYVLGPPRDVDKLRNLDDNGADLYSVAGGLREGAAFHASGQSVAQYAQTLGAGAEAAAFTREWPFDPRLCIDPGDARVREWFGESYYADTEQWRTIDEDWLHVSSDLALQLDSFTNNTSLAIAVERIADGKVLLFPADAQQGNWESWHDPKALPWAVRAGGASGGRATARTVTAADLLERTVFYKVGHHGSFNGTAKADGLERMEQETELTAFIPVDRAIALTRNPQGAWKMPARPLYRRLLEKCQGRVLRSDLGWADDAANAKNKAVEQEFAGLATPEEWQTWKQSQRAATHIIVADLFIDYTLI